MNIRHLLLRYFLPVVACFLCLSLISTIPTVQQIYYSTFEKLSLAALTNSQPTIYFKAKQGTEDSPNSPNKISVLFNAKKYLQALIDQSKRTGIPGEYDYKGFVLTIDEQFIAPLIFFFSLLLVTPGTWYRKTLGFLFGSILILAFAYLTVRFKGLHLVAESGVTGIDYDPRELKLYKLLHFAFSSVTTITVVLLTWILFSFRKSDLARVMHDK